MIDRYEPDKIEKKIQENWTKADLYKTSDSKGKPKFYCLDMFPYPSGAGLHVGHWRGYVLSDVLSRYKLLNGFNILHPMGWDAFGLPAENDAIKRKIHPETCTKENIKTFKRQLADIGAIYDWSREINTSEPDYYKWTQWIFVKMFEKGLAYRKEMPINWCPSCKTGLANEEVTGGVCERCGSETTKKSMMQWMLKITEFSERLLADLDKLDWPENVKKMQANWIGKSEGADIDFPIKNNPDIKIKVFTTRADTLFGATFMVLAPEHALVSKLTDKKYKEKAEKYINTTLKKSNIERMSLEKEKTGEFLGTYAINPINNEEIPIYIADYVLMDYGTGAIMCVPGHDERDFEFAKKFKLNIRQVISKDGKEIELKEAYPGDGIMINSGKYNNMPWPEGGKKITEDLKAKNLGEFAVNYKLRDWVFARQRYWGEPIPIIYCDKCGEVGVPEKDLPVVLPKVKSYEPTGTGESPLAAISEFVNTKCPKCGGKAKRETDTMPQWAGSSWYFLRYPDTKNKNKIAGKEKVNFWLPVDQYVGGIEHAILHLLYARFYTKFLYDIGAVNFSEPFKKLFNQGMVCKKSSVTGKLEKMSKSKGNVVSPDELVKEYGRDSVRMYELFIGPPELDSEWDDRGIEGISRFLNRVWRVVLENKDKCEKNDDINLIKWRHKLIATVTNRIETFKFNTAVSYFMEYLNFLTNPKNYNGDIDKKSLETLLILLGPFVPHISDELWQRLGHKESVFTEKWPKYDKKYLVEENVKIAVQINGKLRGQIEIAKGSDEEFAKEEALKQESVARHLAGKNIVKVIFVKDRILSFVVK